MLVYRIENKRNGEGPYDHTIADMIGFSMTSTRKHPNWYDDFNRGFPLKYYAGVPSPGLIKHWFPVIMLCKLSKLGFVLQVYDDIPYRESNLQVVFLKKHLIKEYLLPNNRSSMYRLLGKLETQGAQV